MMNMDKCKALDIRKKFLTELKNLKNIVAKESYREGNYRI